MKICTTCKTPADQWPTIFRGDEQCSVVCQKAAQSEPATVNPESEPSCA